MEKMTEFLLCIVLAVSLSAPAAMAAGRTIKFGQTTHLVGRDGLCLDVIGGYDDNHIPVQLWPCGSQKNQLWTILADGTIQSMGKCLVPYGNNVGDYAMINDCYRSSTDAKTWKLWPDGTLSHVRSGLVLTAVTSGKHTLLTLGPNEYAPTQSWEATEYFSPRVTNIVGMYSMCLQAQEDSPHAWLSFCRGDIQKQYWAMCSDGTIRANTDHSLCLTSLGRVSDSPIALSECKGKPEQRWYPRDDGALVNLNTGMVMDVRGADPNLHEIILYQSSGDANQRWKFPY